MTFNSVSVKRRINFILFSVFAAALFIALRSYFSIDAFAADLTTAFGSNYYNATSDGNEFPIGIYLRSQNGIGEYDISLSFDDSRLSFVRGADSSDGNSIKLSGNGQGLNEVKVFVYFKAKSGGESGVSFKEASVKSASDGTTMNVTSLATAPIHISGEDTSGQDYEDVINADSENVEADESDTENAESDDALSDSDGADGIDENTDGDLTDEENDSSSVDTEDTDSSSFDINSQTDNSKDGFSSSRRERSKKIVTYVLIAIVIVLIVIIGFFILRLKKALHESPDLEDSDEASDSEEDDSDDDGIWDDIKRKPYATKNADEPIVYGKSDTKEKQDSDIT